MDNMSMMWDVVGGCDKNVVHIYHDFPSCSKISKYCVHHGLEGAWGVGESKEHDAWFVKSQIGLERSFPLIPFLYPHIVVAPADVKFHEQGGISKVINEFGN